MRPVFQRHLRGPVHEAGADPAGDCMAAALASVLELELDAVPNFGDDRTPEVAAEVAAGHLPGMAWWCALRRWLRGRGLDVAAVESLADVAGWASPDAHAIAVIPSPRGGWPHVVVIDTAGIVVHDPYPGPTSTVGALVGRLGCSEVWVLVRPYEPFPDQYATADAG